MQEVYEELQKNIKISEIKKDVDMSKSTSFRIGGKADLLIKVKDTQELKYIVKYSNHNKIPITVIGNGSNLLVRDKGIRGITIQMDFQKIEITKQEDEKVIIEVGSGVKLGMLAGILLKNSIKGFEFASGIPGTIGGATRMNAGAHGKEMKEIVQSTTYMDKDGNIKLLENEEINFNYRNSRFKNTDEIIIEATIELEKGNPEEIKGLMEEYRNFRKEKQPIDMPSAGSTFKRGSDFMTAKLIDEAGLKGYKIGGAKVSEKHAGFIVNTGNATAEDVLNLIDYVIKVIYEKFNKVIELEVEVIGE